MPLEPRNFKAPRGLFRGGWYHPTSDSGKSRLLSTLENKAPYAEYHAAQRGIREALAVKTNIDHLPEIRPPAGIRNRRDSAGDAAIPSGQNVRRDGFWEHHQQALMPPKKRVQITGIRFELEKATMLSYNIKDIIVVFDEEGVAICRTKEIRQDLR